MTATPEQWARIEDWAKLGSNRDACVLELRARVERLELGAGIYDAVAKEVQDQFVDANKMVNSSAGLTGSLVERVALAISRCEDSSCWDDEAVNWTPEARAAIREVAAWLREQHDGDLVAATVLEREAER